MAVLPPRHPTFSRAAGPPAERPNPGARCVLILPGCTWRFTKEGGCTHRDREINTGSLKEAFTFWWRWFSTLIHEARGQFHGCPTPNENTEIRPANNKNFTPAKPAGIRQKTALKQNEEGRNPPQRTKITRFQRFESLVARLNFSKTPQRHFHRSLLRRRLINKKSAPPPRA
jgi:hypothetical protein